MKDPILNKDAERFIWVAQPSLGDEERDALAQCAIDKWISQGPKVAAFEDGVAKTCGKKYGSACNSGTTALHLALHVADVTAGDDVVIPNMTMVALANAVLLSRANPVFCDSDPNSDVGNISLAKIKEVITSKTKAVIVVHTYGEPVTDIQDIVDYCEKRGVKVIEDCAESQYAELDDGMPVGSFAELAILSFYSNKNITTGEGGMVLTDSKEVKERLDRVRMHAFTPGQHFCHTERAFGYRMTDMQASIGLEQLKKADRFMRRRKEIRAMYEKGLKSTHMRFAKRSGTLSRSGAWVMPILANSEEQRDKIRQHIADHGIDSRTYFQPMNEQVFLTGWSSQDYPVASNLARCGFYVPLYPLLSDEDVNYIIDKLNIYND
jgi:perosamine synthetase